MIKCIHKWQWYSETNHMFCDKCGIDREMFFEGEIAKLKVETVALRKMLKKIEWNWDSACNGCQGTMEHDKDCWLAKELVGVED